MNYKFYTFTEKIPVDDSSFGTWIQFFELKGIRQRVEKPTEKIENPEPIETALNLALLKLESRLGKPLDKNCVILSHHIHFSQTHFMVSFLIQETPQSHHF